LFNSTSWNPDIWRGNYGFRDVAGSGLFSFEIAPQEAPKSFFLIGLAFVATGSKM